jgi:seryl-tRNA synthetase
MAKLKKLIKENFSIVGGVVSTPAINAGYGSLSQIVKEKYGESSNNPKVSSKQVSEALKNYNKLGETLYQQQSLKETAKSLSQIAEMAASHTLQETEDWFDKVTVSRNMKELTNHSKAFSKIAEEASSVQQRLAGLYEDMGNILNRYYDIPETHIPGHDDDDRDVRNKDNIEEGDYDAFFQAAMKKFGIKSPDELKDDETKKKFFNYVDKNYQAKSEGKFNEGGPGSGRPSNDEPEEPSDLSDFDPTHDRK